MKFDSEEKECNFCHEFKTYGNTYNYGVGWICRSCQDDYNFLTYLNCIRERNERDQDEI